MLHWVGRRRWPVASAAVGLMATAWLTQIRRKKPEIPAPQSGYVNPVLCASCHAAIAKSYKLTGMGRSFARPHAQNIIESYQTSNVLYHRTSDRYYAMIMQDGRWIVRRHQIGYSGTVTNVVEMEIDYIIGSGDHARSYLHRTADGRLVELPVTWYSEKGGYWAMSPGYDRPDHSDFRRAISYECMSCHNGYPALADVNLEGNDSIFSKDIPEGIDCQRCHGPGRAHVDAASSSAKPEFIRRAIVNPARLSRDRQLDVCMQCHLQTTSLQSPDSVRRYNQRPFAYHPGESLEYYVIHFDFASISADRFEIDHAAYRLAKSKCFEQSQMTCTTCHDPHRASRAIQEYDEVCRNCHIAAHPTSVPIGGKSCLDCHMPKRRTDDVVHAVMTDHYIQKRKPPSNLEAPLAEVHPQNAGGVTPYYPARLSSADLELYVGVAEAQRRPRPRVERLESAIEHNHPTEPEFYFELGRAYVKSGNLPKGIRWLDEALRISPTFAPALKELGAALSDSGALSRAAVVLEKVTDNASALTDLAGVYIKQGRLDEGEKELRRAIGINPDLPAAHNFLGLERWRKEDRSGAEFEFREAIRIQPDLSVAHNNLGNLLADNGDLRQAIFHFKRAIASDPENVDAHHNLGQAFAASGSFDAAMIEFETTVRLDPGIAKAHSDLGRLLTMRGRTREAVEHFRRAIEIDSNAGEAHFYLGSLLVSQKRVGEAEQQFRLAIQSNPDDYGAHLALGRILAARGDRQEADTHFEKVAHSPDPEMRKAVSALR